MRFPGDHVYGFPERLVTKLKYAAYESLFLSSTTGSLNKYFFSCNSTFDPDRTGTGHQPLYRDTYAGIYNQYAVISSEIVVRYVNTNASAYWSAGLVLEDDTSGTSTIDTIAEQSTSMGTLIGPLSSSRSWVEMRRKFDCVRDLNIDPYTSELYKTANGSNPTEEMFFCLWGNDTGLGTSNLIFQVEIIYEVLYSELTTPSQS
jgi:hypothetical protein